MSRAGSRACPVIPVRTGSAGRTRRATQFAGWARVGGPAAGVLGRALEPVIAPLGFDWKIGVGLIGAFAAREVFVSSMGVVYGMGAEVDEQTIPLRDHLQAEVWPDGRRVYTPLVGLSLMVFFPLAAQCMSTLAWIASFCVYQGGKLLGYG